jgi:protein-S-isoprenylcysteine O-methyltransferase Ste14
MGFRATDSRAKPAVPGRIKPEEAFLKKRFAANYISYRENVRRWI